MKGLVHGQPHPGVPAAHGGVCSDCGRPYPAGTRIVRWKRGDRSWAHRHCPPVTAPDPTTDRAADPANAPAEVCACCGRPDPDATISWARGPTLAVHTRCLPALADQLTQPTPADTPSAHDP
jgi:hypothetical protein